MQKQKVLPHRKGITHMEYTIAEAMKLLKKLNEKVTSTLSMETESMEYLAAINEDIESVRPEYDFIKTQEDLRKLESDIRKLKHAINLFNATTIIEGFGMTIDEMLIYIPQLTAKKNKLAAMKDRLPKTREKTYQTSPIIDYRYLNYSTEDATNEYEKTVDTLSKAQNALDRINLTRTIQIDL